MSTTFKVLVVGRINAEHEMAVRFNEELEKVAAKRAAIMAKLKSEATAFYEAAQKVYRYEAKPAKSESYLPKQAREAEPIRILRTWSNKGEFDKVTRQYGVACGDSIPEVTFSSVYYRLNGILVQLAGTGSNTLRSPMPCTDEEWEAIKQGEVPAKFAA